MGKLQYGKLHRTSSSKEGGHLTKVLARSLSSAAPQQIQQNWVEVDLIDFGSPEAVVEEEEQGMMIDPEVLRELVKPFAESTKAQQPVADVFVSFLEYGQRDLLTGDGSFRNVDSSFRNVDSLPLRSNSMRSTGSMSWSDSSDAEGTNNYYGDRVHIKDEDKGSPAARAYNRAFNKLMHKRNHKKPAVSDSKVAKPWDEPLLTGHEQAKLERKMQKAAKLEAKRQAEQAKRDAESQKLELLNLANPIPESALRNQKELYNMRKGLHKLFQMTGGIHSSGHSPKEGGSRDSKLSRGGIFETCMSPTSTDVALSHIRSGPRLGSRRDIQFQTVESNQRDVEAWTMEEYLAKNARIPECSSRKGDKEFEGIEGNQLLNRYFEDDVADNPDSDSD